MKAVQDFNYKVALASGLKHLQAGKLRQAEEQFAYLVKKFPSAEGGYRGLARVRLHAGDRTTAVSTLRDGAAALAKAGERALSIDLLRECVALDPHDLATHRRLAAGLALAGDVPSAAAEYVRYANEAIAAGDNDRARLEAAYALESFGEIPALTGLAIQLGIPLRTVAPPQEAVTPLWGSREDVSVDADADTGTETSDVASEAPDLAPMLEPAGAPQATDADPLVLEARAMALISARDPAAGQAAIEATRALASAGKTHAASDLLLELVASGISVHDAEHELIRVARAIGRADIADERERLLGEARQLG